RKGEAEGQADVAGASDDDEVEWPRRRVTIYCDWCGPGLCHGHSTSEWPSVAASFPPPVERVISYWLGMGRCPCSYGPSGPGHRIDHTAGGWTGTTHGSGPPMHPLTSGQSCYERLSRRKSHTPPTASTRQRHTAARRPHHDEAIRPAT